MFCVPCVTRQEVQNKWVTFRIDDSGHQVRAPISHLAAPRTQHACLSCCLLQLLHMLPLNPAPPTLLPPFLDQVIIDQLGASDSSFQDFMQSFVDTECKYGGILPQLCCGCPCCEANMAAALP